ncbi:MAG: GatB/YqeY domain-containing protein [Propionibacteriaceae bacterium]|nr:GatB/YqeY domain-containing protein [Propionibacteriaceae bacterium]
MGATKTQLKADLTDALRAHDEFAKSNIRMLMGAITTAEVAGDTARSLSDAEELDVVVKEQRKRKDSAETYADAGRTDLAEKETSEAEFMARYLPVPLTRDEVKVLVDAEVDALRTSGESPSMKHMGSLVKAVNAKVSGRAEGKMVAELVRAALNA